MTTVVRAFLEHVYMSEHANDHDSNDEDRDRDDGDVGVRAYPASSTGSARIHTKGPHFFGLRTASISSRLDIRSFPASDDLSVAQEALCTCNDGSDADDSLLDAIDPGLDGKQGQSVRWNGVGCLGKVMENSEKWTRDFYGKALTLRDGFRVSRDVLCDSGKWVTVLCDVSARDALPHFRCTADIGGESLVCSSFNVTIAVQDILEKIQAVTKHHWSADFFGLNLPAV